jgi:MFS family permease
MLTDISSEMVHSLLPMFLVTTMAVSVFTIGMIEGIAESTALVLKVFSGALSDYIGRRKGLAVAGYALSALAKPVFPLATTIQFILSARFIDRLGKGIRDAPRDALIADITAPEIRGAAFGLRQSLDTVGAFLGPLLAVALMLVSSNNFRLVFWIATIPAVIALVLIIFAVREKNREFLQAPTYPLSLENFKKLGSGYWLVVLVGALLGLARFSDAFLILRAFDIGIPMSFVPLIMVLMNVVYAATAYPFGKLSDRIGHSKILMFGMVILFSADICLAVGTHWTSVLSGVALWGLHMGLTQGILSSLVAAAAPVDLRGTAYGVYNFVLGIALLVASALAGFIWDVWGPAYTFYTSAVACLASLILFNFLMKKCGFIAQLITPKK